MLSTMRSTTAASSRRWIAASAQLASTRRWQSTVLSPSSASPSATVGLTIPSSPHLHDSSPSTATATTTSSTSPRTILEFDNVERSFASKSNAELWRAYIVFRFCTIRPIVEHADKLFMLGSRVLGDRLFDKLLKATFFGQFCAGEDAKDIVPVVNRLEKQGLGAILDYAAEADVSISKGGAGHHIAPVAGASDASSAAASAATASASSSPSGLVVQEDAKDCPPQQSLWIENTNLFYDSIIAAGTRANGFAAIKVTAMCAPDLLESVTQYMLSSKRVFFAIATGTSYNPRLFPHVLPTMTISPAAFAAGLRSNGVSCTDEQAAARFAAIDKSKRGAIDFLDWEDYFDPLAVAAPAFQFPVVPKLSAEEVGNFRALRARCEKLARACDSSRARLMVDAEQTYLQPAIDYLCVHMQRVANREFGWIHNTFQCYLLDTMSRVQLNLARCKREGWKLGSKTVRGAYMRQERKRATDMGYDDPIQPNFEATTNNYHTIADMLLRQVAEYPLVIAGHNENTVKLLTSRLEQYGLSKKDNSVYFGQLLGMCDHVSYGLALGGFNVIKVCPYGPLHEVMPYLIRRAQENADVLERATKERELLWNEIMRRMRAPKKQSNSVATA